MPTTEKAHVLGIFSNRPEGHLWTDMAQDTATKLGWEALLFEHEGAVLRTLKPKNLPFTALTLILDNSRIPGPNPIRTADFEGRDLMDRAEARKLPTGIFTIRPQIRRIFEDTPPNLLVPETSIKTAQRRFASWLVGLQTATKA